MNYTKCDMPNYDLYLINTDRFKTIEYKIDIRVKNKKENDKYFPMLWRMLVSTSSKYDSIKEINEACASIYDPYYSIGRVKSGREDVMSLTATFVNEKYTEKGMNEANIKFLSHFLFEPKIIHGKFDEKIFEIKKSKLIENYMSLKDHPRQYADERIDEEMRSLDYDIYTLDEIIEETKKLTSRKLYEFYKEVMEEGKLDIFVCGNIDDSIADIIKKYVKFSGNRKGEINHIINQNYYNEKPNIIIENSTNVQSNLVVGCKVLDMDEFERNYVFTVYCWILGNGMNSLLNKVVREENSLCYYIYSARKNILGCMNIYAGIDGENFDKTYELIQRQMNRMKTGDFPLELLDSVKTIYKDSLISVEDYQNDMILSFVSEIYVKNDSIDKRRKMIDKVDISDVVKFAQKVHIDTVYLLKGDE